MICKALSGPLQRKFAQPLTIMHTLNNYSNCDYSHDNDLHFENLNNTLKNERENRNCPQSYHPEATNVNILASRFPGFGSHACVNTAEITVWGQFCTVRICQGSTSKARPPGRLRKKGLLWELDPARLWERLGK